MPNDKVTPPVTIARLVNIATVTMVYHGLS